MADLQEFGIDDLIQFALDTIQKTGKEALRFYGKGKSGLKFDEALVTEAELHAVLGDVERLVDAQVEIVLDSLPTAFDWSAAPRVRGRLAEPERGGPAEGLLLDDTYAAAHVLVEVPFRKDLEALPHHLQVTANLCEFTSPQHRHFLP